MRALSLATLLLCLVISVPSFAAKILKGQWGGKGASMYVTPNGADGTFNCLFGRIDEPVLLDENKNFSVRGTIDFMDGNHFPERVRTVFAGSIRDDVMQLTLVMENHGQQSFTLEKDELGDYHQCGRE